MTDKRDWFLTPEELQAPTDEECRAITAKATPAARSRFNEAATALSFAKIRRGDKTPWRDLIDAYRESEPMRVEVEMVTEDGVPRAQVAYIERGYGLKGDDALMFNAVSELARAIELIDKERARNKKNGCAGGRPSTKQDEILESLERAIEKHGTKKMMDQPISWIVDRVRFDWHDQHDAETSPPSDNTIRRVIGLRLPEHPKVKKKNCRKPGS